MFRRLGICALASAGAFAVGTLFTGYAQEPTPDVEITVSTEVVGITVTGGALNFGGPHPPNLQLTTHPNPTNGVIQVATAPTLMNTGNMPITHVEISYREPLGAEASCDAGASSWPARSTLSSTDPKTFFMKALAGGSSSYTTYNSSSMIVLPGEGSTNVLANSPLATGTSVPLYLMLRLPQTPTGGGSGCTIGLIVTASAS